MRAFVFPDQALNRQAGRFVWLSIDTEKEKNASFLERFPVDALPSSLVIDAPTEAAVLRWVGAATVSQLLKILDDGAQAARGRPGEGVEQALAEADRLNGEGKKAEAAGAYRRALALAPADWPAYARVAESLVVALQMANDAEGCTRAALEHLPRLGRSTAGGSVAGAGLSCALDLPAERADRKDFVSQLERACTAVIDDVELEMAADDRSGVYMTLIQARGDAKDAPGKVALQERWARFLEAAAEAARDAEGRAVFDSHRLSAYLALGQPEKAVSMLEASERDLPTDYNPPARLATAYKAMKRYDEALAASDRALTKAYGARKVGLLASRADILEAKGDKDAARKTLEQAITAAKALPGSRTERRVKSLEERLAALK
jgi:tetratricopeptide (TPR) repeat protein